MVTTASEIFEALGKKDALQLLSELEGSSGLGFNQLKRRLRTDPKTLTRRLDELGSIGAVRKGDDSDYYLTDAGSEFLAVSEMVEAAVDDMEVDEVVN